MMERMDRRGFLARSAAALTLTAFPGLAIPAPATRSNLLIVHVDEFSFRMLSCYRDLQPREAAFVWGPHAVAATPHIDELARRGAVCRRVYATSPVCTPSRASFVSGLYPQNTGAPTNDHPMLDEVETFAEVLRRAGYATGYAGKWHLDGPARPGWSPARRFGFEDNRFMFNRGHYKQLEMTSNGPRVKAMDAQGKPTYAVEGADEKSFTTDFLANRAIDFIHAHRDQPFCYMVSFPDPHDPNTVRPPYDTMYQNIPFADPPTLKLNAPDLPEWAQPTGGGIPNKAKAQYLGMIKCIDDNLGRIMMALREVGVQDRTIVVFTADHGDMCGEHGRLNKGVPLEGSAHIPFIIAWPGRIKPGTVVDTTLGTVDFKPTILGLLGLQGKARAAGRDASACILGDSSPAGQNSSVFVRHSGEQWLMAVSGNHKLVFSSNAEPCLFDLERDPWETKNVLRVKENREIVRRLGRDLLEYARKSGEPMLQQPAMAADLRWAAEDPLEYVGPSREAPPNLKKKAARRRGKKSLAQGEDE